MTPTRCPRIYEVEALRDGRLTGAARDNFERHLELCRDCARETEALRLLALPLRTASADESMVDQLHVRRERTRLLAAFDRERLAPEQRPSRRSFVPALAIGLGMVAVVFAGWQLRSREPAKLEARAEVRARGPAVWSRHLDSTTERVTLDAGSLEIQVRPLGEKRRFVVVLPDGELEDLGTTFTVAVEDHRTAKVAVQEGSVILRLRGRSPLTIHAGEVWSGAPKPAPASAPPRAAEVENESPKEPAPSASAPLPKRRLPAPRASSVPSRSMVTPPDPSLDFRAAAALLGSGDAVGAAQAFAKFLDEYPRDSRAEDASYLRIIALQRAGDASAMKRAATEYLRRYPSGFRRGEVERLGH